MPETYRQHVEKDKEEAESQLKNYRQILKDAAEQEAYWQRQVDALQTIVARLILDG